VNCPRHADKTLFAFFLKLFFPLRQHASRFFLLPAMARREKADIANPPSFQNPRSPSALDAGASPAQAFNKPRTLAHHTSSASARASPPVLRIEGIAGSGAGRWPELARSEPAPKGKRTQAAVWALGRDEKSRTAFPPSLAQRGQRSRDFDFVGGIHNRRIEGVNRFRRHTFVKSRRECCSRYLAGEGNAHLSHEFRPGSAE